MTKAFIEIATIMLFVAASIAAPYQADEFLLSGWAISSGMGGMRVVQNSAGLTSSVNPALLMEIENPSIAFSGASSFDNLLTTLQAGAVYGSETKYGISIFHVGGDGIKVTGLLHPDEPLSATNQPYIIKEESHHTVSVDFAISRRFGRFHAGASAKGVFKELPDMTAWGGSISLGGIFVPIQGASIGIFLENISTYQLFWSDGVRETGLPKASMGISYDLPVSQAILLTTAAEAEYGIEEHFGPYRAGICAKYLNTLSFALGTSEGSICAGASLKINKFTIGANIGHRWILGTSYLFSAQFEP